MLLQHYEMGASRFRGDFYQALQRQSHSWREVVAVRKKEELYYDIPSLPPVNNS